METSGVWLAVGTSSLLSYLHKPPLYQDLPSPYTCATEPTVLIYSQVTLTPIRRSQMCLKEPEVLYHSSRDEPNIKVCYEYGEEAYPGVEAVALVQEADLLPDTVARPAS